MMTQNITPSINMAAKNYVPWEMDSTNKTLPNYKYLFSVGKLILNSIAYSYLTPITINNEFASRLETGVDHYLQVGDYIILRDTLNSTSEFNGVFKVLSIVDYQTIIIDLQMGATPSPANNFSVEKLETSYRIDPEPTNGYGRLDLKEFLRTKVNTPQVYQGYNDTIIDASSTRYTYNLHVGEEYSYEWRFFDNGSFSGTALGFYNPAITALTGIPFQIGDEIVVEQDLFAWPFNDNYFSSGNLGFTGSTGHNFQVGQTVTIYGQQTAPDYNGPALIISAGTNNIVTNKPFTTSTPVDNGIAYGVPVPQYNGVATITNIFVDPTLGVCIVTDKNHDTNTLPIGGTIKYADGRLTKKLFELNYIQRNAFYNYFQPTEYTLTSMNEYLQLNNGRPSNIASKYQKPVLLSRRLPLQVTLDNKGYTLFHEFGNDNLTFATISFYDENFTPFDLETPLYTGDTMYFNVTNVLSYTKDFYCINGLEYITNLGSWTDPLTYPFDVYSFVYSNLDTIKYYKIGTADASFQPLGDGIFFELVEKCSKFENIELMWEDAFGSFQSYKFNLLSRNYTEAERKNYNKINTFWDIQQDALKNNINVGDTTYSSRGKETIKISTDYINENETYLFEDLMMSKKVYIKEPNVLFNELTSQVQLDLNKIERFKDVNGEMSYYTFEVTKSKYDYR